MSQHQVILVTTDTHSEPSVTPQSLRVKRGDEIVFQSRHEGNSPPKIINVSFTSNVISNFPDGGTVVQQLSMEPNSTVNAMVSPKTEGGGSRITYSVEAIWDIVKEGGEPSPFQRTTTPDLVIDD